MPTLIARATVSGANIYSTATSTPVIITDGYGIVQATRFGLVSNGPFNESQVEFLLDPELLEEHYIARGGNPTGGLINAPYRIIYADGTTVSGIINFGDDHLSTLYTSPDNGFVISVDNDLVATRGGYYTVELDIATRSQSHFTYSNSFKREPAMTSVFCSWITPQATGIGSSIYMEESRGVSWVEHRGTVMADGQQETIVARVHFKRAFKSKESYFADTKCFSGQGNSQMWAPSDYVYWGTRRGIIKQQYDNYVDVWQNKVINANQKCLITFTANGIAYK